MLTVHKATYKITYDSLRAVNFNSNYGERCVFGAQKHIIINNYSAVTYNYIRSVSANETIPEATASEFAVAPAFGDGMVFQQNEPIKIWGTSPCEGEYINAVFDGSMGYACVKDGKWEITMAPRIYSSEPKVLEIYGGEGSDYVSFENITVGDVWWVIGQSNAEYSSSAAPEWDEFESQIRGDENIVIYNIGSKGFEPGDHYRWRKFNKYSTYDASALACFTAKTISDSIGNEVPLAMLITAYAGHEISSFMPPSLTEKSSSAGKKSIKYNDTIDYVVKMPVKGIIWYQGEADASMAVDYSKKLSDYIEWIREVKNQQNRNFPFYTIELPPSFNDTSDPARQFIDFGNVRCEAGGLTTSVENYHVCVTSDLWDNRSFSNNLHPNNKKLISTRLAYMILSREYAFGNEEAYFGPTLKEAKLSDDKLEAELTFNYCSNGLKADSISGMIFIGSDWHPIENIKYELVANDRIKIKSEKPIYIIRYNANTENVFATNIFLSNSGNIPAAAFAVTFQRPSAVMAMRSNFGFLIIAGFVVILALIAIFIVIKRKKKQQ